MIIRFSSMAVRFYEKDGWTWDVVNDLALIRVVYFKDQDPYFVCDRVDTEKLMSLKPDPRYFCEEDLHNTLEENIEMRNI